jgi:hypothetical protein
MKESEAAPTEEWQVLELWKKYEDITMHFNDLLMRLRTQGLAAVAALTTIIGIFAKGTNATSNWKLVAFAFSILSLLWVAVWALDFFYYNQLLSGAVRALVKLEGISETKLRVSHIDLSTTIEDQVLKGPPKLLIGVWIFYSVVFFVLVGGFLYSICQLSS